MTKCLFVGITLLLSLQFSAGADEDVNSVLLSGANFSWFQCKRSDDCIVIAGACGSPLAVNKAYTKDINEYIRSKIKPGGCMNFLPRRWPNATKCSDNKCVLDWMRKVNGVTKQSNERKVHSSHEHSKPDQNN